MVSTPRDAEGQGTGQRDRGLSSARATATGAEGSPRRLGAPSEAPCCDRPTRALLLPYALSQCPEEEAVCFEAHLLVCEACFQDLKVLDRAGVLIREFTGSGGKALDRLRHSLLGVKGRSPEQAKARRFRTG